MPIVALPDGKRINVPEGTSPEQILEFAQSQFKSVRERAQANLDPNSPGNKLSDRVIAEAAQDEKNLYGRVAKDTALAGAAVGATLAAPFTGGASLPVALAAAGGIGAAGSLGGIGLQKLIGSNEVPNNAADLAKVVGFDAASFAAGEGAGRAIGAIGKKVLPYVGIQLAGQIDKGRNLLQKVYARGATALDNEVAQAALASGKKEWLVPINNVFQDLDAGLQALPKQKTAIGRKYGELSAEAKNIVSTIAEDLQVGNAVSAGGQYIDQPLPGVIENYHRMQRAAYPGKDLTTRERDVLRDAVGALGKNIEKELKKVGPKAIEMFKELNANVKAEIAGNQSIDLTWAALGAIAKRTGLPLTGAGVGYKYGGLPGAAAGAAIGAGGPQLAAYALKKTLEHGTAGPLFHKAVETAVRGHGAAAAVLARKALELVGGKDIVRDFAEQESQESAQPSLQEKAPN